MSLRTQILVWFAIGFSTIIFALAFTAQRIMVANLRADLDETLKYRAELVSSVLRPTFVGNKDNYDEVINEFVEWGPTSVPLLLRLTDLQGEVLTQYGQVPEPAIAILNRQLTLPDIDKGRFYDIKLKNREELRVYTVQARDPVTSEAMVIIQTVDSLAPINAAEASLWRYAIIEGVVGSSLAIIIGWFLLRSSFRPLDRILERVRNIRDTNLATEFPNESRPPELQRLADSLNAMLHRLDDMLRSREAFVATVSHELRTPLTAIQGQTDSLLRHPSSNDPEVKDSLERTAREVRRLIRMTNNLLLNAQLDSNAVLTSRQINLRELAEEVVREMRVLTEGIDLGLEEGDDIIVNGDYDLLKQAVLNIIDNAIKFTPKTGHVQVSLGLEQGMALLEVSDSGQGIPQEHRAHLMEPFYKVHTSGRTAVGTGLGLAIVKQVIELHGGKLHIDSKEGVGTKVRIYFPI